MRQRDFVTILYSAVVYGAEKAFFDKSGKMPDIER
jgi:hypothetical protein